MPPVTALLGMTRVRLAPALGRGGGGIAARLVALALVPLAAACGSSGPALPPAPTVIATPRSTADDVEVARVNRRPVWGSCVATQAVALHGSADQIRRQALDQCIAFELLAQAAEARGLAAAPEVAVAVRTAVVDRLIATDFEARYRTPADLKPLVDQVMQRNEWRMHILQLRASTFARFVVPKDAPPALDARAHALAEQLAAELTGQTGLFGIHVAEAAARIAAGSGVELSTSDVKPMHQDSLVAPYAAALYAIPEIGRASPAFRTQWGWDVLVWTGGIEAKERSRDEVVADVFPELLRHQFQLWAAQIGKQLGVHIELDQANIAALDQTGASP